SSTVDHLSPRSFPPRRSSDLGLLSPKQSSAAPPAARRGPGTVALGALLVHSRLLGMGAIWEGLLAEQYLRVFKNAVEEATELLRSEEHTSELQSRENLVCRLL